MEDSLDSKTLDNLSINKKKKTIKSANILLAELTAVEFPANVSANR